MLSIAKLAAAAGLLCASVALVPGTGTGSTCVKSAFDCESVTTSQVTTQGPGPLCDTEDHWVEVSSSATCSGYPAGSIHVLVCSSSAETLSFSGGGYTHLLAVAFGSSWGAVVNNCKKLGYQVM